MESNVKHIEICRTEPKAEDDDIEFYYTGVAANGEIVVTSETYTRLEDAKRAASATFPEIIQHVEDDDE